MSDSSFPSKDTVYIDPEDDITAIIDKIEAAKNQIVALVLPKRTTALQSTVNMRLLARSAKKAGKNAVLITSEKALLPLAAAAELHVAKNLQSKPEIPELQTTESPSDDVSGGEVPPLDSGKSIGELALAHGGESIDLDDEEEKKPAKEKKPPGDKRLKIPNFERFRLLMAVGVLGVLLLMFLLIFGLFVWPKANIAIATESTPVSTNFNLDATAKAKALDEAGGVIPAVLKTSDQTANAQVQATGQQNNGTKATGSATLTNCSSSSVTIPAGTGVSANGLTYITQTSVSLDSGNFTGGGVCKNSGSHVGSTNITAQQGGTKYNNSFTAASVAGYPGVNASGSASGGTDNNITVVSQADVDSAKAKVSGQSSSDFTKNFEKQLSDSGFYVIGSTLKANDPQLSATPAVGQPASTASVTVKVTYSVLVVQKSDLTKAISDQLNKQIDSKKQKITAGDVVQAASINVQSSSGPDESLLQISSSTTAVPTLDVAAIQKQAGGLKSGDIKAFISDYPGVKKVTVSISPFWITKAPKNPAKIHVMLQEAKTP